MRTARPRLFPTRDLLHRSLAAVATFVATFVAPVAGADVVTTPTTSPAELSVALRPHGLEINDIEVLNGAPLQFGTYGNFTVAPVTIASGIVLGCGDISDIGPLLETQSPDYDPASPPARVVNMMNSGGTPEFTAYGATGAITNFYDAYDVASLKVTFTLDVETNVKFDFIFASVEYPFWTSQYTDAFVAFVDGMAPENQVCFDADGSAIQVGASFASRVTTADRNTAFANPHGLIRNLTTTTPVLSAGEHTIVFEVGDVNDMILDSAVFITNFRAAAGDAGTGGSNCEADFNGDDAIGATDLAALLTAWGTDAGFDLTGDEVVGAADLALLLSRWGPCD